MLQGIERRLKKRYPRLSDKEIRRIVSEAADEVDRREREDVKDAN